MSDEPDYEVGYGKPPKQHQFKKGQRSANPAGRGKSGALDVNAFFAEMVIVPANGRSSRMHPFEVALRNLAAKAIKGDIRAARRFLDQCKKAGLLATETATQGWPAVLKVPKDCDWDQWRDNLSKLGPPPWPGEHNGLPHLATPRKPFLGRG